MNEDLDTQVIFIYMVQFRDLSKLYISKQNVLQNVLSESIPKITNTIELVTVIFFIVLIVTF